MNLPTNHAPSSHRGTLTKLRAFERDPRASLAGALNVAEHQAQFMRELLPRELHQLATLLTDVLPTVLVRAIDDMPVPGVAFWSNERWLIHVRASDTAGAQDFTVLHQLKHIIDHPMRRDRPDRFSELQWEQLADHFAGQVLTDGRQVAPLSTTGVAYE